ncbi:MULTISPECIES: cobalamin-binding protein [Pseudoalteromonas]|uniref:ABC transporter substrate-binding protein n=1 Tax=Pseudoalteromonas fuliginea TaxID=1872678 RepID=A0ABD3Y5B1_9GAMM|nr:MULTISPECIES: cobalamin-binding protein [Pseudoalteromonas]ALQ07104.1 ABC transporter substrate-binding protein [Pseudoalteromonas sp. Bsw20308]KDC49335.1 ABC transporter substrate-binding protein [Pseudoalteromonas fuliginea]KJZ28814.1 ABC transporter substrate-binding protein [Pseudoalteromonas fuliginea]
MLKVFFIGLLLFSVSGSALAEQTKDSKKLRIIALAPHIVENLFAIGAGDNIVGTVDYADYPGEAQSIERIGGYYGISLEKVLALKPDLVIAWKSGNQSEDLAQIERLGIKVYLSNPTTIAGVADELLTFGEFTGNIEQSQQAANAFTQKLNGIVKSQQDKKNITGFYQLWAEPMMTVSKNTWISQLIETCHVSNVFAQSTTDYPQISIENVIVTKPQVIIIPDEKSKTPQPVVNWQKWPEVPAVKNDQFISVNADLLHRFTVRMLDGLADMCDKIDVSRKQIKSTQ